MGIVIIDTFQGDFGYLLNFILQDSQGNVFSLVGATSLFFRAQLIGFSKTLVNGAMNITSASAGTCSYTVAAGDFTMSGQYNAAVQVNFGTSETVTFGNIQVNVAPKIPY